MGTGSMNEKWNALTRQTYWSAIGCFIASSTLAFFATSRASVWVSGTVAGMGISFAIQWYVVRRASYKKSATINHDKIIQTVILTPTDFDSKSLLFALRQRFLYRVNTKELRQEIRQFMQTHAAAFLRKHPKATLDPYGYNLEFEDNKITVIRTNIGIQE
jgi:hypothetical protein